MSDIVSKQCMAMIDEQLEERERRIVNSACSAIALGELDERKAMLAWLNLLAIRNLRSDIAKQTAKDLRARLDKAER